MTTFLAILANLEQLLFFSFLSEIFFLDGGGSKSISDKHSRHFSQFEITLILFVFDQIFILRRGGGWVKQSEIISDQFSRHFSQFRVTFFLLFFDKKKFGGGGGKAGQTKHFFSS